MILTLDTDLSSILHSRLTSLALSIVDRKLSDQIRVTTNLVKKTTSILITPIELFNINWQKLNYHPTINSTPQIKQLLQDFTNLDEILQLQFNMLNNITKITRLKLLLLYNVI